MLCAALHAGGCRVSSRQISRYRAQAMAKSRSALVNMSIHIALLKTARVELHSIRSETTRQKPSQKI